MHTKYFQNTIYYFIKMETDMYIYYPRMITIYLFFLFFLSLLSILVSAYKLARSQFSLSTSVNRISIFIVFLNYLLDNI